MAELQRRRAQDDEDPSQAEWRLHHKHVFVLSSAGKPIYSRYGDEQRMAAFMAAISGVVSFIDDTGDTIREIRAGKHLFVFLMKGPIYLVAVADTGETAAQLTLQLTYVHAQILQILTAGVEKIFRSKAAFDLRNLLGGADVFIDSLLRRMDHDASFFLDAVHCLRLPAQARQVIGQAIHAVQNPSLLFGVLVANMRLVHFVRVKKFNLVPLDLHLVMNFVSSSSSFRTSESWTPICLPKFNDKGFLHAHVSYLSKDVCLVLFSTAADAFFQLAECRNRVLTSLNAHGAISLVQRAVDHQLNYAVAEVAVPSLLHFVYKNVATAQFTSPSVGAPYLDRKERKRLFRLYQLVFSRMLTEEPRHKIYYYTTERELVVGWLTATFELYAVFSPLESKSTAIKACNELLRWIKKQEDSLFLSNAPTWSF
jgi:hypothetical protein